MDRWLERGIPCQCFRRGTSGTTRAREWAAKLEPGSGDASRGGDPELSCASDRQEAGTAKRAEAPGGGRTTL